MKRLSVAFADAAHAQTALRFVARAGLPYHASMSDRGTAIAMAVVELEVGCEDEARFRTLVAGAHGLVISATRVRGVTVA